MKIGYFDCFAGAGGDMIVAAMLDAGLDAELLREQLTTLGIGGLDIKISQERRCGIKATRFEPLCSEQKQHRHLEQITALIKKSRLSTGVKTKAMEIFNKLAKAEAVVHGTEVENIHFHEVGAIDSMVDIVSACIGLEALEIEQIYCSELSVGGGSVDSAHGRLPVPAPATIELLKSVPIIGGPQSAELLTPTAAAVLTSIVTSFGPLPAMAVETIGYGAGSINSENIPNVLRFIVGQSTSQDSATADCICLLQANTDDTTGEIIGSLINKLLESGALDAFSTPIYMKHCRPAVQISVICRLEDTRRMEEMLFKEGLSFGIRRQILQRSKLAREITTVKTKFGDIRVKTGILDGKVVMAKPEFSDCQRAAQKHNVPVPAVIKVAMSVFEAGD